MGAGQQLGSKQPLFSTEKEADKRKEVRGQNTKAHKTAKRALNKQPTQNNGGDEKRRNLLSRRH